MLNNENRITYAICKCLLYSKTAMILGFMDEKTAKYSFKMASEMCKNFIPTEILKINKGGRIIEFLNNSCLSFGYSKQKVESEFIRGHRAKLPLIYDNDFHIDQEIVNEVLKPCITKGE